MKALLFPLHAAPDLTQHMLADRAIEEGIIEYRHFPDGESYVRLCTPVKGRPVIVLCGLDRPDERLTALLLAADAAREQGALQVGLVAPYLAYMRQDRAFQSGEAVSAPSFAAILSRHFDWLVTLEPHLHRVSHLDDIFSIPAIAAQATGPIGDWIANNIDQPFLIGPDRESAPWIERIAEHTNARFCVLEKIRKGDRDVEITGSLDDLRAGMTPVVIDDIVSSGATMAAILGRIVHHSSASSVCIVVHMLSAEQFGQTTQADHPASFISCNSVPHTSNRIDISAPLLTEVRELLERFEVERAHSHRL